MPADLDSASSNLLLRGPFRLQAVTKEVLQEICLHCLDRVTTDYSACNQEKPVSLSKPCRRPCRQESIDAVTAGVQSWDPEEYILNSLLQVPHAVSVWFQVHTAGPMSCPAKPAPGRKHKQEAVRNHGRVDLMQKKARIYLDFILSLLLEILGHFCARAGRSSP